MGRLSGRAWSAGSSLNVRGRPEAAEAAGWPPPSAAGAACGPDGPLIATCNPPALAVGLLVEAGDASPAGGGDEAGTGDCSASSAQLVAATATATQRSTTAIRV